MVSFLLSNHLEALLVLALFLLGVGLDTDGRSLDVVLQLLEGLFLFHTLLYFHLRFLFNILGVFNNLRLRPTANRAECLLFVLLEELVLLLFNLLVVDVFDLLASLAVFLSGLNLFQVIIVNFLGDNFGHVHLHHAERSVVCQVV